MKLSYFLIAVAAGFLLFGIFREDTIDILINAVIVCFSCIGIG